MFKQITQQEEKVEKQKEQGLIGSIDLTEPENIDLTKASISITHNDTQYPLHDPVENRVNREQQLSTQEVLNIFEKLSAEGIEKLTITGGEPTLRHDFRTIVQYAVKKFDEVLVQTNGTTDRNLSQHDVTVSIPIEYFNPVNNNEVRRMTNPDKYIYDRKKRRVIRKEKTKNRFNDEVYESKQKVTSSVAQGFREEAIELFNKKQGTDYETWKEMKQDKNFTWDYFIEREEPEPLLEREQALQLAVQKAQQIPDDTPLVIRTNIYSNNNLLQAIAYANIEDAKMVFKPLYPVGRNKKLLEQLPRPERFYKAMKTAYDINPNIKQQVTVDSPLYKAWKYEKNLEEGRQPDIEKDTYMHWWERGRVSDIGVNKLHIAPDGETMPSKYIRQEKYRFGNINDKSIQTIKENMAEFNQKIYSEKDHEPVTGFDLRQRSIATDYNIALTKPYPKAEMEVN
jgi:MoaA/NifB/PqqE/SkfB family radical SAM enzyme